MKNVLLSFRHKDLVLGCDYKKLVERKAAREGKPIKKKQWGVLENGKE